LRPDLVEMAALPALPEQWPLAVEGKDPRRHASADLGHRILALQRERMAGILRAALANL
ncbi:MAG: hypothetical protein GX557_06545, partial [Chloroflexi bacterium]|nr:hypothetical protein [Chloroflexota bacterium]